MSKMCNQMGWPASYARELWKILTKQIYQEKNYKI